jgi:hypothetical protein
MIVNCLSFRRVFQLPNSGFDEGFGASFVFATLFFAPHPLAFAL